MRVIIFMIWHNLIHGWKNQMDEVTDYGHTIIARSTCLKCEKFIETKLYK